MEIEGLALDELPVRKQGAKPRRMTLFPAELLAILERDPELRLKLLERLEALRRGS